MSLNLEQLLHRLGGVATRAQLIELTCRAEVDRALRESRLVPVARGKYALPTANRARQAAAALHGVVSHRSAAAAYGWEMKTLPERPCVTVDKDRTIDRARRAGVDLFWSRLRPGDVTDGWVTSRERTLVDCCRRLQFAEALAIADSALRHHDLTQKQMVRLVESMRGPGRARARRVAQEATAEAANPFESVLRAISLEVPDLRLRPQVLVVDQPFAVRPDLSDERLHLALEADSFEWHGSREALKRDCQRYNLLVLHGWRVLRFTWEDVMLEPERVRTVLEQIATAVRRPDQASPARRAPA